MNRLDMKSKDILFANIERIKEIFPDCISEDKINFDILKQELSDYLVDEKKEKYQMTWPGKKEAIINANSPSTKTLRPVLEKSVDFENTKNVYIEGDNLDTLKILQESYLNKVKCIYIDPPYNTGKDFIYSDNFTTSSNQAMLDEGLTDEDGRRLVSNLSTNSRFHSDWINMIYPRIKLARNLLKDDGLMFISIDDNEQCNLKKICDDIFGESNHLVTIIVNRTSEIATSSVVYNHEYMLVYAKNIEKVNINGVSKYTVSRGTVGNANQTMPEITFPKGLKCYGIKDGTYKETRKIEGSLENIENLTPIIVENGELKEDIVLKARWRSSNDMRNFFANGCKPTPAKINGDLVEIYFENDRFNPQIKKSTFEKVKSLFLDNKRGSNELNELGLNGCFDYPKCTDLIKNYVRLITGDNDIVMDFFSGSATTADAVMQLNQEDGKSRKYIMVQLPEEVKFENFNNICDVGEERIKRASKKIEKESKANIDYGFRVFKVDSSNMKDVYYKPNEISQLNLLDYISNIKDDRTAEDLLIQVILDLGLPLDLKIETKKILNNNVFYVEDNSLIACFDDQIDINIVDEICKCNPMKVVFKDTSFKTDKDKINLEEKIKKLSPDTEVSVL